MARLRLTACQKAGKRERGDQNGKPMLDQPFAYWARASFSFGLGFAGLAAFATPAWWFVTGLSGRESQQYLLFLLPIILLAFLGVIAHAVFHTSLLSEKFALPMTIGFVAAPLSRRWPFSHLLCKPGRGCSRAGSGEMVSAGRLRAL
jgi:hypothetical protein